MSVSEMTLAGKLPGTARFATLGAEEGGGTIRVVVVVGVAAVGETVLNVSLISVGSITGEKRTTRARGKRGGMEGRGGTEREI